MWEQEGADHVYRAPAHLFCEVTDLLALYLHLGCTLQDEKLSGASYLDVPSRRATVKKPLKIFRELFPVQTLSPVQHMTLGCLASKYFLKSPTNIADSFALIHSTV